MPSAAVLQLYTVYVQGSIVYPIGPDINRQRSTRCVLTSLVYTTGPDISRQCSTRCVLTSLVYTTGHTLQGQTLAGSAARCVC